MMRLIFVIISYVAAFIFGMNAQSISYFLEDITPFEAFPILVVCTILCFVCYLFSLSYYWLGFRKNHPGKYHGITITLLILFSLPVMCFSFIVCMFWWG